MNVNLLFGMPSPGWDDNEFGYYSQGSYNSTQEYPYGLPLFSIITRLSRVPTDTMTIRGTPGAERLSGMATKFIEVGLPDKMSGADWRAMRRSVAQIAGRSS
jgi:hypothetical protein